MGNVRIFQSGNLKGRNHLGRPRRRCESNIKMCIWEIGWEGVDWIHLAQDADQWRAGVNIVVNLCVAKKV